MHCFEILLDDIVIERRERASKPVTAGLRSPLPFLRMAPNACLREPDRLRHVYLPNTPLADSLDFVSRTDEYTSLDAIKRAVDHAANEKSPADCLRRLRRRIAWRLHPDRGAPRATSETMSEANALIDRALAKLTS